MMINTGRCVAVVLGLLLVVAGVSVSSAQTSTARALLYPASGSQVEGVVYFTQIDGAVVVLAKITGLSPGAHGFHIHEFGDCSDPQAKSAGGHYNPKGVEHGCPPATPIHVGDMGNLQADSDGVALYHETYRHISLSGPHSVLGRGVVVHGAADDCVSQPSGDAGARVACGRIERAGR